ncbi:MAG: DUF2793 domain-containing protein [Pseudomonadota bacterium]|nr:DUF2793 domain-containing protein [Pseudomonadota bacterium]
MATELLALDEISSSQSQKETTHNAALRQIEGRMVRAKDRDLTTPPGSPANGDTYIIPSGATGVWSGKTNQIAHFYGGAWVYWVPIEGVRLWLMDEDLEYAFDGTNWVVNAGAGLTPPFTDTTAVVKGSADATKKIRFEVDGLTTATTRVLTVPDADMTLGDNVYLAGSMYNGAPTASLIMLHHVVTRQVIFPSGLTGSQGKAGTAATAQTDFDIQKNGSSVGTMRFAAAGTSATFIMASQQTFAAGDILKVVSPASPDATLANITFTLSGTR